MYVMIEENPNCAPDERVFPTNGPQRTVKRVNLTPPDESISAWCDISAVGDDGTFNAATAQRIEDSSDGTAWLIYGGPWGLRLRPETKPGDWSLTNTDQWGLPFLVLDSSGSSIEFK